MSGNGINAMMAHQARVHDDNVYFRSIVQGFTFAIYGKVTKYEEGRVDVRCGNLNFTNVEVLVIGVNGWGIKPVLAEDDRVLLISSQSPIIDIKEFEATGTMPPYDVSGLKAIPVTDDEAASQLITVDAEKVEITGDNKLLINADGVQFEDVNGNKVVTKEKEVSISAVVGDDKTSTVVMNASGITITDAANNNKIEMKATDGVIINGNLQIKGS